MSVQLKVHWSGDHPGLDEHLIDVGELAGAMRELSNALRRLASDSLTGNRTSTGQIHNEAKRLRLMLRAIEHGSAEPIFDLHMDPGLGGQLDCFMDLPQRAAESFVNEVAAAHEGRRPHSSVERYLRRVPTAINHRYQAYFRGRVFAAASYSGQQAEEAEDVALPTTVRGVGQVAAVWFTRPRVQIKLGSGSRTFEANPVLVRQAFELRDRDVQVVGVQLDGKLRLLRMDPLPSGRPRISLVDSARRTKEQWAEALEALAEGQR